MVEKIKELGLITTLDGRNFEDCSPQELQEIYRGRLAEIQRGGEVLDLDEMFHQLNELDETKNSLLIQGLALNGFIALEKVSKLVPYGEIEKIDEETKKYFKIVEDVLKISRR